MSCFREFILSLLELQYTKKLFILNCVFLQSGASGYKPVLLLLQSPSCVEVEIGHTI
uniref:Uncharacterized protein n=1 Tax=Arundo donax TaxID=35708 RepID=A0A0A9E027_ARUDO